MRAPAAPFIRILGIATIFTALEWVRGILFTGLPYLYLGHTQTPFLLLCQIADIFGAYGVTFCVAVLNALILLYFNGVRLSRSTVGSVALIWIAAIGYGGYRWQQTFHCCSPGPIVLLVQPNYPQDNKTGDKGATDEARLKFHRDATTTAIRAAGRVDLVCWSETMMPPILTDELRTMLRGRKRVSESGDVLGTQADFFDENVSDLTKAVRESSAYVLTGALFWDKLEWDKRGIGHFADKRNSAFLFDPSGRVLSRSDKIHLVPFGEFIPFKDSKWFHWLHDIFAKFSPYDFDYSLTAGSEKDAGVMTINSVRIGRPVRLIAPICFEDLDAPLVAWMLRGPDGKGADLLVNLTNDGWFRGIENAQHLQASVFRSIENRVPTARSVNTGISAFIDSYGRVGPQLPARTEGTAVATVWIDPRYTFYTRFGDVFAMSCAAFTVIAVVWRIIRARSVSDGPAAGR